MKNKVIYYTRERTNQSIKYGYIYKIAVFIVKKNKLEFVGKTTEKAAMTVGTVGECWKVLQACGLAPKRVEPIDACVYAMHNNIKFININELEGVK